MQTVWTTESRTLPLPARGAERDQPYAVSSPIKAHLLDGGTIVFADGAMVTRDAISGHGLRYALLENERSVPVTGVPLDSVVGVETFEQKRLQAQSVVLSIAATTVGGAALVGLLKALFGSCPTVYSDSASGGVLQAEGFSYAIAPMLEHRDVDPLAVRPGPDGIIRLELRNEALETHFINHIELLAARAPSGSAVVPDQDGRLVAVSARRPLARAVDRAGRDVRAALASADGVSFASAAPTVDSARAADLNDWIDLEANDLPPGDSIAVVLRLRNSLLNTVLLYDGILGGRDAPDWLASGMQHIGVALDLTRWYVKTMGMHITVDGAPLPADGSREHARLGDVGPIAFSDVAVVLPRPAHDARQVRVRLRFVADDWRIDRAEIAATIARPTAGPIRVTRVIAPAPANGGAPAADTAALHALADADDRYLETRPGQRMTLEFAPMPGTPDARDSTISYFIAWQGWYREWIRGSWLRNPVRTQPWVAGDSAVSTALTRWRTQRESYERTFYSTRVPVR